MGSTSSKIADSPADVINIIEVVDHKDELVQEYLILQIITSLLIVLILLKGLRTYRNLIQKHNDRGHELEKMVTLANHWTANQKH